MTDTLVLELHKENVARFDKMETRVTRLEVMMGITLALVAGGTGLRLLGLM